MLLCLMAADQKAEALSLKLCTSRVRISVKMVLKLRGGGGGGGVSLGPCNIILLSSSIMSFSK